MNMYFVKVALTVALVLGAGCASYPPVSRQPLIHQYDPSRQSDLWQAALLVLQSQNYPITVANEAGGLIVTDWINPGEQPCPRPQGVGQYYSVVSISCKARQKVSITISAIGQLIVNVNRQLKVSDNSDWFEPNIAKTVEPVQEEQRRIYAAITQTAKAPQPSKAGSTGKSTTSADRPADGTERGNCYGNGTCNQGLSCYSGVCVDAEAAPAGIGVAPTEPDASQPLPSAPR